MLGLSPLYSPMKRALKVKQALNLHTNCTSAYYPRKAHTTQHTCDMGSAFFWFITQRAVAISQKSAVLIYFTVEA